MGRVTTTRDDPSDKLCVRCQAPISIGRVRRRAKFCTNDCSSANTRELFAVNNPRIPVPTGTVGAISEMRVAVDLFTRGFSVFRALSPACGCDLIAMRGDAVFRVEVKTAYIGLRGVRCAPKARNDCFDIMAYAYKSGLVEYDPPLK